MNPKKGCVVAIQAFFENLNTKVKIENWVKKSGVRMMYINGFSIGKPFLIDDLKDGGSYMCELKKDGTLQLTRSYLSCQ